MAIFTAGYMGPREIKYLFIDGACLRKIVDDVSKQFFKGIKVDIDYGKFSREFTKVFYYDSLPAQKKEQLEDDHIKEIKKIKDVFNQMGMLNGFHVYQGISRLRRGKMEQKQVDTMIAIDMLTHTFRRNMHQSTLLASDDDFKPLIDALVQNGMYVSLWYGITENSKTNPELIAAADARRAMGIRSVHAYATNDFQQKFTIPISFCSQRNPLENLVEEWADSLRGSIKIYEDKGVYRLIFPENEKFGQYIHVEYHDLELLKIYVEEEYGVKCPGLADSNEDSL